MKSELTIQTPDGKSHQVELKGESLTLGRQPDCDIAIPAEVVSRKHARLEKRADGWWYIDLDSRNGSWRNGERIRQVQLQDGLKLQLGQRNQKSVTVSFRLVEERVASKPPAGLETVIEKPEPTTGYVDLRAATPPKVGRQILGRGKEADIQLNAPVISREHASIQPGTQELK